MQEFPDSLQVLLGQDFRRSHDAGLIAVVDGNEHGHQCYEGFARAHVALQQTVHLAARAEVGANLVHDALLGTGEGER